MRMRRTIQLATLGMLTVLSTGCGTGNNAEWIATGMPALNRTVAADRPIPEGKTIEADDVLELPVSGSNIPADSLLCKDSVIGKQCKRKLEPGAFVRSSDIADGKNLFEEQSKKFQASGKQLSSLCSHTYSKFYESDAHEATHWKCASDAGVADGAKCDLNDFESIKGAAKENELQNCWMLAGRASSRGMFQGHAVTYSDIDYTNGSKVTIYKPLKDIPPGKPIEFKDLKAIVVQSDVAPVSAVCDAGLLGDSVAHVKIPAGKVIQAFDLEDETGNKATETASKEASTEKVDEPAEKAKPAKTKGKGKKHK